jgi:preprotein translocase subunit SecG
MQTFIGWLFVICSGLTILYNVVQNHQNERQIEDHPLVTLFSGGENLKPAYTFMPPYTGFEVVVIAVLIVGGILVFNSKDKSSSK